MRWWQKLTVCTLAIICSVLLYQDIRVISDRSEYRANGETDISAPHVRARDAHGNDGGSIYKPRIAAPPIKIYRYKAMDSILTKMSGRNVWALDELDPLFQFSLEKVLNHNVKRSAVLTDNPEEADFYFVPFYGRMAMTFKDDKEKRNLQVQLWDATYWTLLESPWFWRRGGVDHIIVHSHTRSTYRTYNYLWELVKKCTFISYEGEGADTRDAVLPFDNSKDILVPYLVPHGIADGAVRPNQKQYWAHFRGSPTNAIRRNITALQFPKNRTVILDLLENRLAQLTPADKAYKMHVGKLEMRQSVFCICPGGLTPSSQRMFVAIAANCIPVIVSDNLQLPFENLIDYSAFTVRVKERRVNQIPEILERYTPQRLNRLQRNLKVYRNKLLFNQPYPQEGDAFSMILDTLLRKKSEHPELYMNSTIT